MIPYFRRFFRQERQAGFNHLAKNQHFLINPGNEATAYGVSIQPAALQPGQVYWRVIGVYHLTGEENHGQSNIFLEVLDEGGRRISSPTHFVGWTWDGRQDNEPARPVALDKPNYEPAGNINLGFFQTATVWLIGPDALRPQLSDKVAGLHTRHGDPAGDGGNYNGHHSFYVVWQRTIAGQQPGPGPDPEPEPEPEPPGAWRDDLSPEELWIVNHIPQIATTFQKLVNLLDGKE